MALERPEGADLLDTARRLLLDRLLPALPEELRYDALMVASAIAMGSRELNSAEKLERAALKRLAGLYPDLDLDSVDGKAARSEALDRLGAQLVADIRDGAFDEAGGRQKQLLEHLRETTRARMLLSNPKRMAVLDTPPETGKESE